MKEFVANNKGLSIALCGVIIAALAFATVLVAKNAMAGNAEYISVEAAKATALADSGEKEKDVTFTRTRLDDDDGTAVYDIEFYSKAAEYDYEIDAITGLIASKDVDRVKSGKDKDKVDNVVGGGSDSSGSSDNTGGGGDSGNYIGVAKAKSIALGRAGLSSATWVHAYLDYDDGRATYELEFRTSKYEYDVEIDAKSGSVIGYDKERRDDDRDDDDWDD